MSGKIGYQRKETKAPLVMLGVCIALCMLCIGFVLFSGFRDVFSGTAGKGASPSVMVVRAEDVAPLASTLSGDTGTNAEDAEDGALIGKGDTEGSPSGSPTASSGYEPSEAADEILPEGASGVLADGHPYYHIIEGDTLSSISSTVHYSVQELAEYNRIRNVNLIYAESDIRIPAESVSGNDIAKE